MARSTSRDCTNCMKIFIALVSGCVIAGAGYWYDKEMARLDKGDVPAFNCKSDLKITGVTRLAKKGIALDSVTSGCSDKIPQYWPHTQKEVKVLRVFSATQQGWGPADTLRFRNTLAHYVARNGAQVLVGTQITCDEDEDDEDWKYVRELLKTLGSKHVFGLAVGNELDLLSAKTGVTRDCVTKLWGSPGQPGYLLRKLQSRIAEARQILKTQDVYVTSVFTAAILWSAGALPFQDTWNAKINSFVQQLYQSGESRWAFTLNFYPYFDPTLTMDPDNVHCEAALKAATCFDDANCKGIFNMVEARRRIEMFSSSYGFGASAPFWVGEVGWSAPAASTLTTAMSNCKDFSSYSVLYNYYKGFLTWDMTVPGYDPPDMVFFFTARDATNFDYKEYFGLMESCSSETCKLDRGRITPVQPASSSFLSAEGYIREGILGRESLNSTSLAVSSAALSPSLVLQ